ARGNRPDEDDVRALVAGHPERRAAVRAAAAARDDCDGGDRNRGSDHGNRFERTAPLSVAQTRPCFPVRQVTAAPVPPCVLTLRPSTWITAPTAAVVFPASSCSTTR